MRFRQQTNTHYNLDKGGVAQNLKKKGTVAQFVNRRVTNCGTDTS